jgi:hypothetical protein
MKFSRFRITAIAILLVIGLTCVGTFVEWTGADDYTLVVTHYNVYV